MALNQLGLGFVFTAKDEASRVIDQVERKFTKLDKTSTEAQDRFKKQAAGAAVGVGMMAAGASIVAAGIQLAGAAGEFEQGMAKVGAIAQATTAEMAALRNAALEAGMTTKFAPKEAAQALENLAAQGFNATESIGALRGVLNLATGGMIGLDSASNAVSAAIKVFSLQASDATSVVDKMLRISNTTSIAAADLEQAMGGVARGASAAGQNLDEMLISMGLVKNTGVDISVAATAVSSALQYVAGKADKFKALGVAVTDSSGKFRDFVDIVMDTKQALDKVPNAADRTAQAVDLFSRFGVTAYQAIATQLDAGVRNATGQLLQGQEALAFMRQEMANASGTAQGFSDKLMDTFEGQKTRLKGVMASFAVVVGEGFAAALKPVAGALAKGLEGVTRFLNKIPADTRAKLAKVVFAIGGLVAAVGTLIAAKAGIALLVMAFKALGISVAALLAPLWPIAVALGVVVMLAKGMSAALGESRGGILTWVKDVGARLSLFASAMGQLFTDGGFSGDVRKELNKAENSGVKDFAIKVFMWVERIREFLGGIGDGFAAMAQQWRPVFEALHGGLMALAEAFGVTTTSSQENAAAFDSAGQAGRRVGEVLAMAAGTIANALVWVIATVEAVIAIFKELWAIVWPVVTSIGTLVSDVVGLVVGLLMGDWTKAWQSAVNLVLSVAEMCVNALVGVLRVVTRVVDGIASAFGADLDLTGKLADLRASIEADVRVLRYDTTAGAPAPVRIPPTSVMPAGVTTTPRPATEALMSTMAGQREAVQSMASQMSSAPAPAAQTINLVTTVNMDGEKVGQAQSRVRRESRARSFLPMTPAEEAE